MNHLDYIDQLERENLRLATGACLHPDESLEGDDYGNLRCTIKAERDALGDARRNLEADRSGLREALQHLVLAVSLFDGMPDSVEQAIQEAERALEEHGGSR